MSPDEPGRQVVRGIERPRRAPEEQVIPRMRRRRGPSSRGPPGVPRLLRAHEVPDTSWTCLRRPRPSVRAWSRTRSPCPKVRIEPYRGAFSSAFLAMRAVVVGVPVESASRLLVHGAAVDSFVA